MANVVVCPVGEGVAEVYHAPLAGQRSFACPPGQERWTGPVVALGHLPDDGAIPL
jgi:hypothetical protein